MPAPVFQAVGAQQNSATASVNVSWPTHQTNDIGLMVIETSGGGTTLTPPTGWAAVPGTPVVDVATAAGSKLHVWWKRAASSAEAAVATGFSTSDHVVSRIYTFRGCITTGNPWDVTTTGTKTTASTTATVPAVTTTVADTLIAMIVGRPDDSLSTTHFGVPTNANLTGLAEAGEAGTNNGDGGGFTVAYGTDATAGNTGTSSISKTASTTDTYVVIAFKQPTAYTMAADKATFTLTGNAAGTLYGRKLIADVRSYALTGNAAGTLYGRKFIGDVRSYALTGNAAGLNKGVSLTAQQTSFALTGKDANFPRAYRLTADKATFTFTGRAAQFPLFARPVKFFLPERNLLTRSEEFDISFALGGWSKSQSAITANVTTAPDGTATADKLSENSALAEHITYKTRTGTNETLTFSVYAKASERTKIQLQLSNFVNAAAQGQFDLSTGLATGVNSPASDYSSVSQSITSVGNGWYRCSLTATKGSVNTANNPVIASVVGSTANYQGDGSSGVFIWGAQLEEGSTLTAYDPTGPAAAGRTDLRIARKLTADAQSYTLTGKDATLTKTTVGAYTLTADTRNYALTGNAAGLAATRKLTADATSFTLTGRDTALRRDYRLTAAPAAYTLTGSSTGLLAGRRLTADSRSYALSGAATGFLRGIRFPAATGSYTLTGFNAALVKTGSYSLLASPQSYTLTGQATGLAAGRKLTADTRSFTLTGNAATLVRGRTLSAASGVFAVTGQAAGLQAARRLVAATSACVLAGQVTGLGTARRLVADVRAYVLSGSAAGLARGLRLLADARSHTLTGIAVSLSRTRRLLTEAGAFLISSTGAGFNGQRRIYGGTGNYALTGNSVATLKGFKLATNSRSFTLSAINANLYRGFALQATSQQLALSASATNLLRFAKISVVQQAYALDGKNAAIIASRKLGVDTTIYTLTTNPANLTPEYNRPIVIIF